MSIKIPSLTRTGLESLKDTVRRSRREPYSDSFCCDSDLQPNPDLYIAKVPYDGIPAAQTFLGNEIGGRAQCELFTLSFTGNNPDQNPLIVPLNKGFDLNNQQPIPLTAWVYNYHNWRAYGKVFGGSRKLFVEVKRAKSGQWVCERPQQMLKCKPVNNIAPGQTDQVAIWLGGNDSTQIEYATNNWKNGGTRIAFAGEEHWIFFCPDEGSTGQWVFVFDNPPQQQTGIPFVNHSGGNILPYSVYWANDEVDILGSTYIEAINISSTFDFFWLVNRGNIVPNNDTDNGDWLFEKAGPVAVSVGFIGGPGSEIGPKPGSNILWPDYRGFITISNPYTLDGVYVVDCIQKHVLRFYGRLYADVTQNVDGNATTQVEIWNRRDSDKKRFFSGWNKVDVYFPLMLKGDTAKTGTFAFVDWGSNMWEADPACDPDNTNSTGGSGGSQSAGAQLVTQAVVIGQQTF